MTIDEKIYELLDNQDLIYMIKGTGGPNGYDQLEQFKDIGELNGFPNERWEWNNQAINHFPKWKLIEVYLRLKKANAK